MRIAASGADSCSQTRTESHPAAVSRASVLASRRWLLPILAVQYPALVVSGLRWIGQPCQKHPSTNTATFAERNTRTAVQDTSAKGRAPIRYRRPSACTAERSASSGLVSRLRLPCMTARAAGVDAHGL